MRRFVLLIAILVLYAPAQAQSLDPILASAMAGTRTPGMAAIVLRDGRIADEAVRGARRNDSPAPARLDDLWHIGSDGKALTATLIARLVERGKLNWTTPLSDMLPDLAANMRPEYQSVTLLQLLSHTAGLPHDVSDMRFFSLFYDDKRPPSQQRVAYAVRALSEAPAVPAGTFSYSNTGFIIAAVIAERLTGTNYEELMRREVFRPLGMTSVGFGPTRDGEPAGHHDGRPATAPRDFNPLLFAPAGNIHLSMRDWAAFCLDQMAGARGKGKLLTAASYRMMQTPHGGPNGLGWGVVDSLMGRQGPALTHAGSDGNWYALVVLFPQTGNGVLVAANAGEDMGGDKAGKAVVQAVLPSLAPAK